MFNSNSNVLWGIWRCFSLNILWDVEDRRTIFLRNFGDYLLVHITHEGAFGNVLTRPISSNFITLRLNTKQPVDQWVPLLGVYVAAICLEHSGWLQWIILYGFCDRAQLKCDGTRAETRFRLSAKRTSPFKSAGGVSSVDYWQLRCAHQR